MPHGTWSRAGFAQSVARADLSLQQIAQHLHIPLSTVEGWLDGTQPRQDHLAQLSNLLDSRMGGEVGARPDLLFDHEPVKPPFSMSSKQFLASGWRDKLEQEDAIEATRSTIARLQQDINMTPRGMDSYGAAQRTRQLRRQIQAERDKLVAQERDLSELNQELAT